MIKKISYTAIRKILDNCKINPKTNFSVGVLADVKDETYYLHEAKRLIATILVRPKLIFEENEIKTIILCLIMALYYKDEKAKPSKKG